MNRLRTWLPALAWMGVIFAMSAMPGDSSGQTSGRLVHLLLSMISFLFGQDAAAQIDIETIHLLIRKGAHMTEYAILYFLYFRALRMENTAHPGLCALLLCALYAATDEWHQSFVADRGPSVMDVAIDTLGAGAAFLLNQIKKRP